jgi:hypothetical protein
MPVRGQKPKPDHLKRNRMPVLEWNVVPDVPFVGAPKLPVRRKGEGRWPVRTLRWWAAVASMPHCSLWRASDWEFALDTAAVAATFHATGSLQAEAALFRREKILGTTVDARRDLRIRYVPVAVEVEVDASVTTMADYRALVDG